jgi:hypothetical protein
MKDIFLTRALTDFDQIVNVLASRLPTDTDVEVAAETMIIMGAATLVVAARLDVLRHAVDALKEAVEDAELGG